MTTEKLIGRDLCDLTLEKDKCRRSTSRYHVVDWHSVMTNHSYLKTDFTLSKYTVSGHKSASFDYCMVPMPTAPLYTYKNRLIF